MRQNSDPKDYFWLKLLEDSQVSFEGFGVKFQMSGAVTVVATMFAFGIVSFIVWKWSRKNTL